AFDQRTDAEAVRPRHGRRLHAELEPRDLTRTDVRGGLHAGAVEARPSGRRRATRTVAAKDARLILARLGVPRPEVCDLTQTPADPAARARVEIGDRRGRAFARAEAHVSGLSVPRRVESGEAARHARRWCDARTDRAGAC